MWHGPPLGKNLNFTSWKDKSQLAYHGGDIFGFGRRDNSTKSNPLLFQIWAHSLGGPQPLHKLVLFFVFSFGPHLINCCYRDGLTTMGFSHSSTNIWQNRQYYCIIKLVLFHIFFIYYTNFILVDITCFKLLAHFFFLIKKRKKKGTKIFSISFHGQNLS